MGVEGGDGVMRKKKRVERRMTREIKRVWRWWREAATAMPFRRRRRRREMGWPEERMLVLLTKDGEDPTA